jgi:hypothetical protein
MADRTIVSFDHAIKNILRDKSNFNVLSGFLTELVGRKVTLSELVKSESNRDNPTDVQDQPC